jgi:hypothetical protein
MGNGAQFINFSAPEAGSVGAFQRQEKKQF